MGGFNKQKRGRQKGDAGQTRKEYKREWMSQQRAAARQNNEEVQAAEAHQGNCMSNSPQRATCIWCSVGCGGTAALPTHVPLDVSSHAKRT